MTKPNTATDQGLDPHWKVRVVLPGAIVHLASRTRPTANYGATLHVDADWIDDHRYADTLGHIRWDQVIGITWRYAP